MGFRNGAYAKVWQVDSINYAVTKVQISISRKNKTTGEYATEFSGYIAFMNQAAFEAAKLNPGDRVKLLSCDVRTKVVKDEKSGEDKYYTNYYCYGFEKVENTLNADGTPTGAGPAAPDNADDADEDDPIGEVGGETLPF